MSQETLHYVIRDTQEFLATLAWIASTCVCLAPHLLILSKCLWDRVMEDTNTVHSAYPADARLNDKPCHPDES